MSVTKNYSLEEVFQELDSDKDGLLNKNELKTMCAQIEQNCPQEKVRDITIQILNSTAEGSLLLPHCDSVKLSFNLWKHSEVANKTQSVFCKRKKYKHEVDGTDEVAFLMIRNEDPDLEWNMDGIRKKRHKFICLNDNLNHSDPSTPALKALLFDFYMSLFPHPSAFELPPGKQNPVLYIEEYRELKRFSTLLSYDFIYYFLNLFLSFLICSFVFWLFGCPTRNATKKDQNNTKQKRKDK